MNDNQHNKKLTTVRKSVDFQPSQCLVLSAGTSSRMGYPKALLPLGKSDFLNQILLKYDTIKCINTAIVLNPENAAAVMEKHPLIRSTVNPFLPSARTISIVLGLIEMQPGIPVWIQDVDRPFVNAETLRLMLRDSTPGNFVCPVYGKKNGHPVLLGADVAANIISGTAPFFRNTCNSGKAEIPPFNILLKPFHRQITKVADAGVLLNINTPWEYLKQTGNSVPQNQSSAIHLY